MELFKHELYKIFLNKSVGVILAIVILLNGISFTSSIYFNKIDGDIKNVYLSELEGPFTEEKIEKAEEVLGYLRGPNTAKGNVPEKKEEMYLRNLYLNINLKHSAYQINKQNVTEAEKRILSTDGFDRRSNILFVEMLKNTQKEEYYFTGGWNYTIGYVYSLGAVFMAVLILLGLSPMFSGEYTAKMDSLILSSKYGRTKLIRAKIFAGILFITAVDLFINTVNLLENLLVFGVKGWNAPIQCLNSYMYSPYSLTVLQYYFIHLLIHVFACIVFGMFVMLVSSLCKTQILVFFIGAAVYLLPFVVNNAIAFKTTLANLIIKFSFLWFMQVEKMFNTFKVYNIFGYPVFYPIVGIVLMIIFILFSRYYIYNNFKNHNRIY